MEHDQFGKQIAKERRAGKPEKQAVAIAARKVGKAKIQESAEQVPGVSTTIPTTLPTLEDSKFGKK